MTASAPQELLYVSPMLLAPGSIIEPGNFGKNILGQNPTQGRNGWPVVRELIFDQVRFFTAPHLPSRLHCNFLFTSTAAALHGGQELATEVLSPCIYNVEITDPEAPQCMGDFDTLKTIDENHFISSTHAVATAYWHAAATNNLREGCLPELLTASPIRILRRASYQPHILVLPTIRIAPPKDLSSPPQPSLVHQDSEQPS
ncbi:hypothetical protein [uncultured Castellaniella sp.]|uniref:hypothetical protein n=1 Tax=uncultured Castellaniella sp. TaxID=647907 RepID=UPI002632F4C7|nr:hypothetical protein [uncultured Castellaniella sp.]